MPYRRGSKVKAMGSILQLGQLVRGGLGSERRLDLRSGVLHLPILDRGAGRTPLFERSVSRTQCIGDQIYQLNRLELSKMVSNSPRHEESLG